MNAIAGTIIVPLSIDVSTGDAITPSPTKYTMTEIFDEERKFELWGYNPETILAEKVEAILNRGIYSTRPRDHYDVYILSKTKKFNIGVLSKR